jgi:Flp pilus assembly secretin CpaC
MSLGDTFSLSGSYRRNEEIATKADGKEHKDVTVNKQTIPGVRIYELSTGLEMQLGETVAISGLSRRVEETSTNADGKERKHVDEIRQLVIVTVTQP